MATKEWDEVFHEVRKRVGLGLAFHQFSQAGLAREAGVSPGTISRVLRGKSRNMYVSTLYKLAKALKVSPNWLLGVPKKQTHKKHETKIVRLKSRAA